MERRVAWNDNPSVYGTGLQPGVMDGSSSTLEPRTSFSEISAFGGGEQMAISDIGPFSVSETLSPPAQPYSISSLQELEEYTLPVPFDHPHATSNHFIFSAELSVDGTPRRPPK